LIAGEADQVTYMKRYLKKDGRAIDVEVSKAPVRDETGAVLCFVVCVRDVTRERALIAQLSHQALHDQLTGLANRALFEDRFSQANARAARQGEWNAVMLLDLDDFKAVNDTLGHHVGDDLLVAVARRLEEVTRSSDTLCRLGGDEFLYLAEGLASPARAEEMAERLLGVFANPIPVDGSSREQRQHRRRSVRPDWQGFLRAHPGRRHRPLRGQTQGQRSPRPVHASDVRGGGESLRAHPGTWAFTPDR
jgi:diguanylate cyclase (GGDEF)-like protein